MLFDMGLIRFLDLNNIYLDTKIILIDTCTAKVWPKTFNAAAILKFQVFGGNHWSDILVPAIFGFSTLKNPYIQLYTLLSGSAWYRWKIALSRCTTILEAIKGDYFIIPELCWYAWTPKEKNTKTTHAQFGLVFKLGL